MVAAVSVPVDAEPGQHRAGENPAAAGPVCGTVLRFDGLTTGRFDGLTTGRFDGPAADGLHRLGLAAFDRNESVAALDYIGQAIDADRSRPEFHNSLGNVYRALGRPLDAIAAFREALRLQPGFSVAYSNLGIVLAQCGQGRGAAACFQQAVELDPQNGSAWLNWGSIRLESGDPAAVDCFERAVQADPNQGTAHAQLAQCRRRAGRMDEAIAAYERARQLIGESAPLLKDLAASYLESGRSPEAEQIYRGQLERHSNDPAVLLNLAQALKDQKKYEEAIAWYERGIAIDPNNGLAHYALGRTLHLSDRFAEAINRYQACLALGSTDPKAAYHLGNACKSLKRLNEAIEAYLQSLQWDPEFVPALYQLGNAYRHLGDLDAARMCLDKVLKQQPDDFETLCTLGNILKEQDNLVGAAAAYKKFIHRLSDEPLWDLWLESLCPKVFHSAVGIEQYRSRLLARVQILADMNLRVSAEDIAERGCPPTYQLQFHGCDDRPLKEAYARVFRNCAPAEPSRPADGKPRVGFVVTDGHEGVFLRYLRGVLERLDRKRLEPVIICSAAGELLIRAELPAETIPTFVIPSRFDQIVERIRGGGFAVLYHWEIGSDVTNYFLPFFRLAPIQCTGAGLPVTSGIPQIDYFLSNEICEPERGQRAYSEKLIRARSLLTWQRRPRLPRAMRTRCDFGVTDEDHIYLCPHKISKFHPDFDGLLSGILRRDPRGIVVIPKDPFAYATRKLENRFRLNLPHVAERVRFVPYQTVDGYYSLIDAADVLLDPIFYGGGLTSFDGLALAKPIVTLPGEFVRGRYTCGFYRAMGVADCIAGTQEEYIKIAVKLGTDRDWRRHVTDRIRPASDVLFEEEASVLEYDRIFQRLVDEALNTD